MTLFDIIFLSIGLAVDCFAVSIAQSQQTNKTPEWGNYVLMALLFGLFQGAMPLITFFAGISFADFFGRINHWIALALLAFIGGKMIYESCTTQENEENVAQSFAIGRLLLLAVATSIDALSIGVLFIPCPDMLWLGVGIIAAGSFVFSIIGCMIGYYVGKRFTFNMELVGGIILVLIGLKIFITHYLA